jgi:hypothetical protein
MAAGLGLPGPEHTLPMYLTMRGAAFAADWLLPRRAREMH